MICNRSRLKGISFYRPSRCFYFLRTVHYSKDEIMKTMQQIYDVKIDNLKEPIWSINLK
jgi:hypothetical protein